MGACFRSSWWPLSVDERIFLGGRSKGVPVRELGPCRRGKRNQLKAVGGRLAGSRPALVGFCGFMGY